MKNQSRRNFIKTAIGSGVGLAVFPAIIPPRLPGADAPGKKSTSRKPEYDFELALRRAGIA